MTNHLTHALFIYTLHLLHRSRLIYLIFFLNFYFVFAYRLYQVVKLQFRTSVDLRCTGKLADFERLREVQLINEERFYSVSFDTVSTDIHVKR
jgi:hypothetical protein